MTNDGRFIPGQSGNPGGRPKSEPGFRDACRKLSTKALKALEDILSSKANPQARVAAARVIIEHGHGRALQTIETHNEDRVENTSALDAVRRLMESEDADKDKEPKSKAEKPVH